MKVRGRLAVGTGIAVAVVAGGLVLERRLGARPLEEPDRSTLASGAWYCPHGGGEGWRAWVVVANPGQKPAPIRLTTSVAGAPPQVTEQTLEPGTTSHLEVPASQMASASVLEYFGAPVAVGMAAVLPEGGATSEPCSSRASIRWHIGEASTLRGEDAHLVVHNPFASEAVVEVALTAGGSEIRQGRLKGVVLSPGEVKAVVLDELALGEEALTATVTALLGRVSAAGITLTPGGARSVLGVPESSREWMLPGPAEATKGQLVVSAPGASQVPFRAAGRDAESEKPLIDLELLQPGTAASFEVPGQEWIVVQADGPQPLVAARRASLEPPPPPQKEERTRRGRRDRDRRGQQRDRAEEEPASPTDQGATAGAPSAEAAWVALPPGGPGGGPTVLLLHNPGSDQVQVSVKLLGQTGPVGETQTITIAGAAAARVELPSDASVAAVVRANNSVTAAQVLLDPSAFALSSAVALP
jgi:hypothetical protein